MSKRANLVGEIFGRLTVRCLYGIDNKRRNTLWLCNCICGKNVVVPIYRLRSGNTKSCGCYNKDILHSRGDISHKIARFWKKVNKTDYCWNWIGCKNENGYGRVHTLKNKLVFAHRFSWMIHFGEIKDKLMVLHKCDNRLCVNPQHLFLGTHMDNMLDMKSKNRQVNYKGSLHNLARLSEKDISIIRFLRKYHSNEFTLLQISDYYKVSFQHISAIALKKKWTHM